MNHPQSKTKFSRVKSEFLIKYNRIKWAPTHRASLLLLGGEQKSPGSGLRSQKNRRESNEPLAIRLRSYPQMDKYTVMELIDTRNGVILVEECPTFGICVYPTF